ncbi:MAG: aminotransferase class V-fold PLP-dependent enzyme, partial [Candidatus Aminicenantaceae bacterium]
MIYLDNNATTPLDPAVAKKMSLFLKEQFGNPSSLYPIGRAVKNIMNQERETIAQSLGSIKTEIFFTGSGTEADNFAIRGVMDALPDKNEFILSKIEHPAVIETANYLNKQGITVKYVPVDSYGTVDLDYLKNIISKKTALIS